MSLDLPTPIGRLRVRWDPGFPAPSEDLLEEILEEIGQARVKGARLGGIDLRVDRPRQLTIRLTSLAAIRAIRGDANAVYLRDLAEAVVLYDDPGNISHECQHHWGTRLSDHPVPGYPKGTVYGLRDQIVLPPPKPVRHQIQTGHGYLVVHVWPPCSIDKDEARRAVRNAYRRVRRARAVPVSRFPVWMGGPAPGRGRISVACGAYSRLERRLVRALRQA